MGIMYGPPYGTALRYHGPYGIVFEPQLGAFADTYLMGMDHGLGMWGAFAMGTGVVRLVFQKPYQLLLIKSSHVGPLSNVPCDVHLSPTLTGPPTLPLINP